METCGEGGKIKIEFWLSLLRTCTFPVYGSYNIATTISFRVQCCRNCSIGSCLWRPIGNQMLLPRQVLVELAMWYIPIYCWRHFCHCTPSFPLICALFTFSLHNSRPSFSVDAHWTFGLLFFVLYSLLGLLFLATLFAFKIEIKMFLGLSTCRKLRVWPLISFL